MITTMKVMKATKERLDSLDLSGKGKTYDMIINELVNNYQKTKKEYNKDSKQWKEAMKAYEIQVKEHTERTKNYNKQLKEYNEEREIWNKLLKWAKSQGFKG